MRSNTRIIVLRSKKIICCLGILIAFLLILSIIISLFSHKASSDKSASSQNIYETDNEYVQATDETDFDYAQIDSEIQNYEAESMLSLSDTDSSNDLYTPGIYASTLMLGSSEVELQITVDSDHINSITLSNLNESIETMYPLVKPALDDITAQILDNQSIENVHYSNESRYTSMLLLQAISTTLDKAKK